MERVLPVRSGVSLRLVGGGSPELGPGVRKGARVEIARENHVASGLGATVVDVYAGEVAAALEGGPAAILRPEVRRRLVARAGRLGIRPFEANLTIALVQEEARHPRAITRRAVRLVGAPGAGAGREWLLLLAAVVMAFGIVSVLVAWVMGG